MVPIWQKNKPWLSHENNHMVAAVLEFIRQTHKGLVGSGFIQAGAFSFPGASDNIFRMAESRVVIDGIALHIGDPDNSQLNIIDCGAPPGAGTRDDLVFLEMWAVEVAPDGATHGDDSVYKQGGVDNSTYTNDIQDTDIANLGVEETTRRMQLRWRIRVVNDVDFATYPSGLLDPAVLAQGEEAAPVATYTFSLIADEKAGVLYRAGAGNTASFDALGAVDGYVYAIPIAKVARATADTTIASGDVTDMRQVIGYAATTHATEHEPGGSDEMTVDATAGTGSLRTLGTGAQQAAAGNHTHGEAVSDELAADITINASGSFFDGPEVELDEGTWFVTATLTIYNGGAAGEPAMARLYDGTNILAITEGHSSNAAGNLTLSLTVSAIVVLAGTTTITAQAAHKNVGAGTALIKATTPNFGSQGKHASHINAVRVL